MILLQTALLLLLYGEGRGSRELPHVTAPGTWRLGVPELVFIRGSRQSESFPVTVSVVSYPDKKRTFSSAVLRLTPEKHFRGAAALSVTAADSPGQFVYLLVESKGFREETRIPVISGARISRDQTDNPAVRRRRHRSVLTEPDIQEMTKMFKNPTILQCCRNGSDYYSQHFTCENRHNEELKQSKLKCYNAYEYCCSYTERADKIKPAKLTRDLINSTASIGSPVPIACPAQIPAIDRHEEVIRITVTQSTDSGTVTSTFTVKIDPDHDVSVQLSSPMFDTSIAVSP